MKLYIGWGSLGRAIFYLYHHQKEKQVVKVKPLMSFFVYETVGIDVSEYDDINGSGSALKAINHYIADYDKPLKFGWEPEDESDKPSYISNEEDKRLINESMNYAKHHIQIIAADVIEMDVWNSSKPEPLSDLFNQDNLIHLLNCFHKAVLDAVESRGDVAKRLYYAWTLNEVIRSDIKPTNNRIIQLNEIIDLDKYNAFQTIFPGWQIEKAIQVLDQLIEDGCVEAVELKLLLIDNANPLLTTPPEHKVIDDQFNKAMKQFFTEHSIKDSAKTMVREMDFLSFVHWVESEKSAEFKKEDSGEENELITKEIAMIYRSHAIKGVIEATRNLDDDIELVLPESKKIISAEDLHKQQEAARLTERANYINIQRRDLESKISEERRKKVKLIRTKHKALEGVSRNFHDFLNHLSLTNDADSLDALTKRYVREPELSYEKVTEAIKLYNKKEHKKIIKQWMDSPKKYHPLDEHYRNALHHAAMAGNADLIEYFITKQNFDANQPCQLIEGMTAIDLLVLNAPNEKDQKFGKYLAAFETLVSKGAKVSACVKKGGFVCDEANRNDKKSLAWQIAKTAFIDANGDMSQIPSTLYLIYVELESLQESGEWQPIRDDLQEPVLKELSKQELNTIKSEFKEKTKVEGQFSQSSAITHSFFLESSSEESSSEEPFSGEPIFLRQGF